MTHIMFRRSDTGVAYISEEALTRMLSYRQTTPNACEAGGVLLGRHRIDSHDIFVEDITTPHHLDKRTRITFVRSKAHQRLAMKRWKNSGETCGHLGLWHTHPESDPHPSDVDIFDWRKALHEDHYEGPSLIFVIVGTSTLRMWQGYRDQPSVINELHMMTPEALSFEE